MRSGAVDAIVTDIEGTTGSIAFVKDVLFPYAEARIASFIAANAAAVAPILADVRKLQGDPALSDAAATAQLLAWSREDRKIGPLKTLQGMIWEEGYRSGELKGHVYPDAVATLRAWNAQGIPLYVYSSGSVQAQKLLFGHTAYGDLTPLFSGYFDTAIGGKLEAASYAAIAASIGAQPARLLFLSDNPGEIAAARAAGLRAVLLDRDSAAPNAISTFDAIDLKAIS